MSFWSKLTSGAWRSTSTKSILRIQFATQPLSLSSRRDCALLFSTAWTNALEIHQPIQPRNKGKSFTGFDDLTTNPDSEESNVCESCIRLFISGQRNGVLEERLKSYPSFQLETAAAHTMDIESYAKRQSAEICKKFRISTEVERYLVNRVTSGAKG